jgi:hypothetical protein
MHSPFDGAIPRLSVLLIAEEEQSESRRRAVAALNAKRWDRVSAAVTKLVPRLRRTFADPFGWLFCLKPQLQRRNPRPAADLRVCLVLRLKTDRWQYS